MRSPNVAQALPAEPRAATPTIADLQSKDLAGAWVTCCNPICLRSTPVRFEAISLAPETPFPAIARTRRSGVRRLLVSAQRRVAGLAGTQGGGTSRDSATAPWSQVLEWRGAIRNERIAATLNNCHVNRIVIKIRWRCAKQFSKRCAE